MENGAIAAVAIVALVACSPAPAQGPVEVTWDRDTCERCNMTIGDRRFAAQIRIGPDHRSHGFDDLGCALLWLDEEDAGLEEAFEIWVRDRAGETWLDARSAGYVETKGSPMGYGFGAVRERAEGSLGLAEVHERARAVEERRRARGR
jgi:nitrous oxide reductase accessory protein NosL